MNPSVLAADAPTETIGEPWLNIAIFGAFVLVTLAITFRASRNNKSAADYYAAGRTITGQQNGLAIAGDYLSAASFLGIAGAIAVFGYDGFLYSIGFLVAWLVALLLVAELMRNTARYTMADVLAFRMRQGPVRTAAAISTLAVSLFYLLAQMAGAGGLVTLLLGVTGEGAQAVVVVIVGALMIFYVLVGGMRGTTWVQIIKASLLIAGALVMTVWVLGKYGFNLSALLGGAQENAVEGRNVIAPGAQYGATGTSKLDFVSLGLALVLGTAGLPHVLMRFYTVPTAKDARKSVVWAIWLIGIFYLFSLVIGYGAGALVGADRILTAPGAVNAAAPLLAFELGGTVLLGIIAGVAFATILAVVAGLTITASASFAHDVYASVIKKGNVSGNGEVHVARITAVVIGAISIGLGILALQAGPEHRLPGGAGLRGRRLGQPADDHLHAVLAEVHDPGRAVVDLRRADHLHRADHLLAGGVGCADRGGDRQEPVAVPAPGGLPLVPVEQPRPHLDPGVVLPRLARDEAVQGEAGHRQGRRARGAGAHRHRCGEGGRALTRRPDGDQVG